MEKMVLVVKRNDMHPTSSKSNGFIPQSIVLSTTITIELPCIILIISQHGISVRSTHFSSNVVRDDSAILFLASLFILWLPHFVDDWWIQQTYSIMTTSSTDIPLIRYWSIGSEKDWYDLLALLCACLLDATSSHHI
jgi:hypothetical protein